MAERRPGSNRGQGREQARKRQRGAGEGGARQHMAISQRSRLSPKGGGNAVSI